jgi:hypothetical protein
MVPNCFSIKIVRKHGTNIVDTTNDINILDNASYNTERPIDIISMRIVHNDHITNIGFHDDDTFGNSGRNSGITLHFSKKPLVTKQTVFFDYWFLFDVITGGRYNETDHRMVDEIEKIYKKSTSNIKQTIVDYLNNSCPPNQIQQIANKIDY